MIRINGVEINAPAGATVSVIGDEIRINGAPFDAGKVAGSILKIEIQGEPLNVRADRASITVNGNVAGSVDAGGSVQVSGSVTGSINSGGSAVCGAVQGDIDAGGSVTCGDVAGNIDAGGKVVCQRRR